MFLALEVLDKVPTPQQHLLTGLLLGTAGFFLCLRWPKALWLALPTLALFAWTRIGEYSDPYVGPALWAEGGPSYAAVVAIACGLLVIPPVVGAYLTSQHRAGPASARGLRSGSGGVASSPRWSGLLLDLGEVLIVALLPEWLWPPSIAGDEPRRFLVAVLLATLALGGLLALGGWLTGVLVI